MKSNPLMRLALAAALIALFGVSTSGAFELKSIRQQAAEIQDGPHGYHELTEDTTFFLRRHGLLDRLVHRRLCCQPAWRDYK